MSHLLMELLLVLVLSALIGWFMGRYFCKNNEYEERNLKVKSLKENKLLQTNLKQIDQDYSQSKLDLKEQHNQISTLQQSNSGLEAQINTLNKERDEMRAQLQQLDQFQTKFQALRDDFNLQKKQLLISKEQNIDHSDQVESLLGMGNTLEKQLDTKNNANDLMEKKLLAAHDSQQHHLEQVQSHKDKEKKYQHSIKELEGQYLNTAQESEQYRSQLDLMKEEKRSIQDTLESLREEKRTIESNSLKLKNESLGFGSKLTVLLEEKDSLAKQVEQLTIENNDYLGRLRAVSSVISVVGTNT